jgi:hypothetical protein
LAISIGANFSYNGKFFLDERQSFATLEAMRAFPEHSVPEGFIAFCQEDGKRYEFRNDTWIEFTVSGGSGGGGDVPSDLLDRLNQMESAMSKLDTPATYTQPTVSLSASPTTIQASTDVSVTITPRFNKNDAGDMTSCSITGGQQEHTELSAFSESVNLAHGASMTFNMTANYGEGPIKQTGILGIDDPNNIKAGSKTTSVSIRAYALSYRGAISGDAVTEADVASFSSELLTGRSRTYTFNLDNQRCVFMYPSSFGNLSDIKDANGFGYMDSYNHSTMTYNGVEYNVYVLKDPTSISGFVQNFS